MNPVAGFPKLIQNIILKPKGFHVVTDADCCLKRLCGHADRSQTRVQSI